MRRLLGPLVLLAAACGDDDASAPLPAADAGGVVDAGAPTAADTGAPVESKAVALVDWVDDLVDHHTDDVSLPDTVDDKLIVDDEDPNTFNGRF